MKLSLIISTIMMMFISMPAYAYVTVIEDAIYYDFLETNPKKVIKKAKNVMSPVCISRDRTREHGIACTKIRNQYTINKIQRYGKLCRVQSISITLYATYNLPKWANTLSVSPKIREQWKALSKKVIEHESKHVKIYKKQFEYAYREIKRLKIDCTYINTAIGNIISIYSARTINESRKLDRRDKVNLRRFPK